ncbi:MAG: hypothetical protein OEY01_14520 [Desulfobulbaceae bacterium]|nr:hypothetical protein [Desulfobulbaceae bacterium]
MDRRRQSTVEDLIEIASKLPWKVGVGLTIVPFVILHLVAGIKVQQPLAMANMGAFAGKQLYVTLAMYFQCIIPVPFLFGSLLSFIKQRKSRNLYKSVEQHTPVLLKNSDMQAVETMTWREFEMLVCESFRTQWRSRLIGTG